MSSNLVYFVEGNFCTFFFFFFNNVFAYISVFDWEL
jgi:hypothetical protein